MKEVLGKTKKLELVIYTNEQCLISNHLLKKAERIFSSPMREVKRTA